MNALQQFLVQANVEGITKEVDIGGRLSGHPITIKPISGTDFKELQRISTVIVGGNKEMDAGKFNEQVILKCVTNPNLRDTEMMQAVGAKTAQEVIYKVFLAGEIASIVSAIMDISGFNSDINDKVEQVKNS